MATTLWPDATISVDERWVLDGGAFWSVKDTARGVTPGDDLVTGGAVIDNWNDAVGTGVGGGESVSTVAGPVTGKIFGIQASLSRPVDQDFTLSGSIQFQFCARESSMNANATLRMAIYRLDAEGALTLIVNSLLGTELATSTTRYTWTATPTSTAMKKGDRLVLVPMIDDATAVTMGSGFTVFINHGGDAANLADSNVQFTETFGFLSNNGNPSGTSYYFRDTASDISGEKALSTTQGSGTATAVHTTVAGPVTFPGDQWTATAGGADISWMTPQLAAFTLSGFVKLELGAADQRIEDTATPFDAITIEIARVNADGTSPTIWTRGYMSVTESSTPSTVRTRWVVGPDLAISQGQRLRVRIYQDDNIRYGTAVAGTNRTIRYDGTSTYASRLIFTQTITEGSVVFIAPKPIVINQAVHRAASY